MRRVIVNNGNTGLVYRRGNYQRLLTEGSYWMKATSKVKMYDMTQPFFSETNLTLLLRDKTLANMLHVVDVADNEIVLVYANGIFQSVLSVGKYAFWKGIVEYSFVRANINKIEINEAIDKDTLSRRDVIPFVRSISIDPGTKGVLFIEGKFDKILDSGEYLFWRNATKVHVSVVDTRQQQLELSGQEILTRDKTALRINFFAQYEVTDIVKALVENKDYEKQLYITLQLALREFVGTLTLDELLEKKESVSEYVLTSLSEKVSSYGVELTGSGVRDIILPGDVKEIMNQVLVAQKKAQANIITRREETASTRSLLNTAKLMEENEMLFKLKEMEYVEKIADKINNISLSGGTQVFDQLKQIFSK